MSTNFSLFCHVLGTNHRDGFLVKIAASEPVAELVSLIKAEKSIGGEISLWKVEIPYKEFEEKIEAYKFDEAQKLSSFAELSDVFPTPPLRGVVHIVVKTSRPANLALFCHVLGTNHEDGFFVDIAASELVIRLRDLIQSRGSIGGKISLWKVEIPHKDFEEKIGTYEFDEAQKLPSFEKLSSIFPTPPLDSAVHIVVKPLHIDAPAEPATPARQVLSLCCHILDVDPRDHFSVDAETSWTILTLENHIKEVGANRLVGVDADYLVLWKVSIPIDPRFGDAVDERDFDEEEPLAQEDKLSDVFPTAPPQNEIHIVARPYSNDGIGEIMERRKALFGNKSVMSPSDGAKPVAFRKEQEKENYTYACGRPLETEPALPLALLHPVFGQFIDDCKNIRLTAEDLACARELQLKMSEFYYDESDRRDCLRVILDSYGIEILSLAQSTTTGYIENEMCGSETDPSLQAFLHYHTFIHDSGLWKDYSSYHPCFIMFVAGPYIGFGGCALVDRPWREMFSLLPLNFHSTDGDAYDTLARHLAALKRAVRTLEGLYSEPDPIPYPPKPTDPSDRPRSVASKKQKVFPIFPHPTSFSLGDTGRLMEFRHIAEMDGRLIFHGRTKDRRAICIKYVRKYGKEAHSWCASQGFAPELIVCKVIEGGWIMVVMELLDKSWTMWDSECYHRPGDLKERVYGAVSAFHEKGMVHGDLRDVNIMVKGLEFRIIDFDWAGKVGEAHYPRFLNKGPDIGRLPAESVGDFMPILREHDEFMIDLLLR